VSAETATGGSQTEYIQHHLEFLQWHVGEHPFWTINLDSVVIMLVLAALFTFFFIRTARKATAGVPGKFQTFVEMVVTTVDGLVRETFHGQSKFIARWR
jgi:F-type H+-transporting ATPase subunit a